MVTFLLAIDVEFQRRLDRQNQHSEVREDVNSSHGKVHHFGGVTLGRVTRECGRPSI